MPPLGDTEDTVLTSYDLDIEGAASKLRNRPSLKAIGLQLPDGLRDHAVEIAKRFEAALPGVSVLINADPSFGACDIALNMKPHIDVLVHFGHTDMPSISHLHDMEVLFVAARHKAPVADVVRRAAALGGPGRRVGLLTTAQHAHKLDEAAEALRSSGFEPVVGIGDNRIAAAGQLLGCNFTAGSVLEPFVDKFVYVGSGDFHPIAIEFGTKKPVILADPYTGEVRTIEDVMDRLVRQRFAAIEASRTARRFGILVSLRVGQERIKLARGLKKMLEDTGREAHIIALDFFSWDNLQYFRHLDAFVNTGCPRVTIDDVARYPKPLLTPQELEIVLGKRTWEEYAFDEFKGTKPAPKGQAAVVRLEKSG
ncbi:MAG: diphthamide biosynthesis enzyme Dph2 [Thermoplasmatota archaeon]